MFKQIVKFNKDRKGEEDDQWSSWLELASPKLLYQLMQETCARWRDRTHIEVIYLHNSVLTKFLLFYVILQLALVLSYGISSNLLFSCSSSTSDHSELWFSENSLLLFLLCSLFRLGGKISKILIMEWTIFDPQIFNVKNSQITFKWDNK